MKEGVFMNIDANIRDLLGDLDACRVSRGMSRKSVADACGVSEATISRIFNGTVEPTYQMVQAIIAAVQYNPDEPDPVLAEYTQEGYVEYLRATIRRQSEENDRRVRQLQSHYNMLRRQDRRTITVMGVVLGILVVFICALFLYDFAHLDRGWIQAEGEKVQQAVISARDWLRGILWSV